jgi:hypothetical protein
VTGTAWRGDFAGSAYFTGLRDVAARFSGFRDWPEVADLNLVAERLDIRNASGLALRFETQDVKCGQFDYEAGIHAHGRVPTRRHSWHDFFNAMVWLAWPSAKAALNALQARTLASASAGRRGACSDAATLFDESGVVLVGDDAELPRLLAERRWREAFWMRREAWRGIRVYVVGHSLLEKHLARQPGITGKCLYVQAMAPESAHAVPGWLDAQVANAWTQGKVSTPAQIFPMPLQGVPGFDPANTDAAYYANTAIFRPARETVRPTA